jgi:zinc resistance-associated protein
MKKTIVAAILISGLAMTTAATANWNGQRGNGDCPQMSMQAMQNLDEATKAKVMQFRTDNQQLFKEMVMKRAEKKALMRSDNPDPKLAAQVAGELFDLRTTIRLKAVEAGVAQYMGPMNGGCDRMGGHGGRGKFQGRMMNQ